MNKNDEKRKQINEDNEVDPCDTCQYRKVGKGIEAKGDEFLGDDGKGDDGDGGRPNMAANGNTTSGDGGASSAAGSGGDSGRADSGRADGADSGRPAFSEAECRQRCKRSFWTEFLRTIAKVAGVVLAAFGLQSFDQTD